MQAMPSSGYLPDSWPAPSPLYVSKHNPVILYNDVRSDPQWRDHIQPYQNMTADLNGPNPPRYVWISPDLCNDMHGGVTAKIKGFPETPCPYSNVAGDPSSATPATPARCIRSGGSSSTTTDLDGVWMAGKPLPGQPSRHIARVT